MTDPASPSTDEPAQAKQSKRKWGRRIAFGVVTVLVLVLLLVGLLPTLISTATGTRAALSVTNSLTGYAVQAKSLDLNWSAGQEAQGLSIDSADESWSLAIDRLRAPQLSLLATAFGERDLGQIKAHHIRLTQKQVGEQPSQRPRPEAKDQAEDKQPTSQGFPAIPKGWKANVSVDRFTYKAPNIDTFQVNDFQSRANLSDPRNLEAMIAGQFQQAGQTGNLHLDLALLDAFSEDGQPQLAKGSLKAVGELNELPIAPIDRMASLKGRLLAAIGPKLTGKLEIPKSPINELTGKLTLKSEHLSTDAQLARIGDQLQIKRGSRIQLQVTPKLYQTVAGASDEAAIRLLQPFTASLTIGQLTMPRPTEELASAAALRQAAVEADLSSSDIVLDVPTEGRVSLKQSNLAVRANQLGERLQADLNTRLNLARETAPLRAEATVNKPLAPNELSATLTASQLPIGLADAVAQQKGRLVATVGRTSDLRLAAKPADQPGSYSFNGELSSTQLEAPLSGVYRSDQGGLLKLRTEPQPLKLTLPPEATNAWIQYGQGESGQPAVVAISPMTLTADVKNLTLAMSEAGGIDYQHTGILAQMTIDELRLRERESGAIQILQGVNVKLAGKNLAKQLKLKLQALLQGQTPGQEQASSGGKIESHTQITRLVSDTGQLQPAASRIESTSTFQDLPSLPVDALLRQQGLLVATLGSRVSGKMRVRYESGEPGNADLEVDATNAQGFFDGRITENSTLQLDQDTTFSLDVTPAMSNALLKRINPLLGAVVAAQAPLKLTLKQQDFAVPLKAFSFTKAQADARLARSDVILAEQGLTGNVIGLLKQLNAVPERSRYGATIKPVNMTLRNGILSYDQLALVISDVELNVPGRIDLLTKELDLKLMLNGAGVPKEVHGLPIGIGGTISQPKLAKGKIERVLVEAGIQRGLQELLKEQGEKGGEPGRRIFEGILGGGQKGSSESGGNEQEGQPRTPLEELLP